MHNNKPLKVVIGWTKSCSASKRTMVEIDAEQGGMGLMYRSFTCPVDDALTV